jgi:hypothetical protein
MQRKQAEVNESFMYGVVDYDHMRRVYTLKNRRTGAVIEMQKDDLDSRLAGQADQLRARGND